MSIVKLLRYTSFVFLLLVWSVFTETAWTQPLCVKPSDKLADQRHFAELDVLRHRSLQRVSIDRERRAIHFYRIDPTHFVSRRRPFTPDQTYYYVVRPATVLDTEICQSNEVHQIFQIISITAVPTMTEWGMIIFTVLLGIGSVYYLRRQRAAI